LPTGILEARNYNKQKKDGARRPFEQPHIVIAVAPKLPCAR
jgi:hypothetical protein